MYYRLGQFFEREDRLETASQYYQLAFQNQMMLNKYVVGYVQCLIKRAEKLPQENIERKHMIAEINLALKQRIAREKGLSGRLARELKGSFAGVQGD